VYGRRAADNRLPLCPERQMLHAAHLAFAHPVTGVAMDFTAPLPADFEAFMRVSQ